jgi:hypothetical protein
MSTISGLLNQSRSLRVDAGADSSATMSSALGVAKGLPVEMKAMGMAGGDCSGPNGATFDFDVSRLLASKIANVDHNSMAFLGESGPVDSSRSQPGMSLGLSLPELGTMNSFGFGAMPSSELSRQLELLALHQNIVLEERFRRKLLSEVFRPTHALGFSPSSFGLGSIMSNVSNNVGDEGQSSIELLSSYSQKLQAMESQARGASAAGRSLADILSCPPTKKQRLDHSTIAVLLDTIPKQQHKHIKDSFPVPSSKRSRKVRVQDLAALRAQWRKIRDRGTTRCSDPRSKEAFDKELFARSFASRGSTSLEGRFKEVAEISALQR